MRTEEGRPRAPGAGVNRDAASLRVALVVDNPFRDLPGLALVAWRLCQSGVTCHLVPYNLQRDEIWSLMPDFVLLNFLRKSNEDFVAQLTAAGITVGVLDTEGGVLPDLDFYAVTLASNDPVRKSVACFCSWGPLLAEHAVRNGWFEPRQLEVTGTPRYDFYAEPWRAAAVAREAVDPRLARGIVLFNGNFPFANPAFQSPEAEAEMYVTQFGLNREQVRKDQARQKETLTQFVAMARAVARAFPDTEFVYRPHPFEGLAYYAERFSDVPNLHLVKEGSVDAWILRARAVIQRSCSTAIEAAVSGVPALSPKWIPALEHIAASEDVSLQCMSEAELGGALGEILAGRFSPPPRLRTAVAAVERDWFFKVDGRSHERVVARVLADASLSGRNARQRECRKRAYLLAVPGASLRARARRRLAMLLRIPAYWSFRSLRLTRPSAPGWDASEKRFGAAEVYPILAGIDMVARAANIAGIRGVAAEAAHSRGDYRFGYVGGRAVAVHPAES